MIKIFVSVLVLGLPFAPLGAQESALDGLNFSVLGDSSVPAPEPRLEKAAPAAVERAPRREWTVLVFLNAKNNLESFGMQDMNEMESVGSSDRVNVVVQMGRMAGYDSSDGNWTGVRRYLIKKDASKSRITSPVVQDLGRLNMGDGDELRKFIAWGKQNYPARRYALIVWNHGNGWLRGNPAPYEGKGISFDDETGNNIDTPQLGRALADAGGVDLLASDACLMQMAEVAYEVKDAARYMVGSEETEPGAGYDYAKVLKPLVKDPSISAEAFGRVIVNAYWGSNMLGFRVATHSLVDLAKASALAGKMDVFARAAMASPDKAVIQRARSEVQSYAIAQNKDLRHFARLVERGATFPALKTAARDLGAFIENGFVLHDRSSILPRNQSNGIAAYIPDGHVSGDFAALKLASDTQWDEFLRWQGR